MAHLSDTSLWLHNKLGTSNDLWSGGSICSQLNQDVLRNIRECFIDLQSQVKLKLLLSFLHIPRRNVEEWKVELEEVIEVAMADGDQWVSMLAELLKTYPTGGTLNFQIEENFVVFNDLVVEMKKLVRKHSDQVILPMECLYLNRNSLASIVGQLAQPVKHFALKRKPKSAALRAELLQKSSDAASNIKRNPSSSSVPIRCRGVTKGLNDAGLNALRMMKVSPTGVRPLQMGANRLNTATNRSVTKAGPIKKDGGIKLLDINEQPMGYGRDAKRRKKQQENEVVEQKKDKETTLPIATVAPTTPDYAAGLLSTSQLATPSGSVNTPANTINYVPSAPSSSVSPAIGTSTPASLLATMTHENFHPTADNPPNAPSTGSHTATIGNLASMGSTTVHVSVQSVHQQIHVPAQPQKKGLSLSREQMLEAQEMFKNSNKVTRPEKALILGFMAGSRDNPCPQLGSIVTIKLSENEETVLQQDGRYESVIVETHFQMNYSTGEWKKVKKYRKTSE